MFGENANTSPTAPPQKTTLSNWFCYVSLMQHFKSFMLRTNIDLLWLASNIIISSVPLYWPLTSGAGSVLVSPVFSSRAPFPLESDTRLRRRRERIRIQWQMPCDSPIYLYVAKNIYIVWIVWICGHSKSASIYKSFVSFLKPEAWDFLLFFFGRFKDRLVPENAENSHPPHHYYPPSMNSISTERERERKKKINDLLMWEIEKTT